MKRNKSGFITAIVFMGFGGVSSQLPGQVSQCTPTSVSPTHVPSQAPDPCTSWLDGRQQSGNVNAFFEIALSGATIVSSTGSGQSTSAVNVSVATAQGNACMFPSSIPSLNYAPAFDQETQPSQPLSSSISLSSSAAEIAFGGTGQNTNAEFASNRLKVYGLSGSAISAREGQADRWYEWVGTPTGRVTMNVQSQVTGSAISVGFVSTAFYQGLELTGSSQRNTVLTSRYSAHAGWPLGISASVPMSLSATITVNGTGDPSGPFSYRWVAHLTSADGKIWRGLSSPVALDYCNAQIRDLEDSSTSPPTVVGTIEGTGYLGQIDTSSNSYTLGQSTTVEMSTDVFLSSGKAGGRGFGNPRLGVISHFADRLTLVSLIRDITSADFDDVRFLPWLDLDMDGDNDPSDLVIFDDRTAPILTCPADVNSNGTVSVQDLFDFQTYYYDPTTYPVESDFNASGSTTIQDYFDFLTAYFNGC